MTNKTITRTLDDIANAEDPAQALLVDAHRIGKPDVYFPWKDQGPLDVAACHMLSGADAIAMTGERREWAQSLVMLFSSISSWMSRVERAERDAERRSKMH